MYSIKQLQVSILLIKNAFNKSQKVTEEGDEEGPPFPLTANFWSNFSVPLGPISANRFKKGPFPFPLNPLRPPLIGRK